MADIYPPWQGNVLDDLGVKHTGLSSLNISTLTAPVYYTLTALYALLGLVGNALLYRLTRHPKFKDCSFRVYLAYLSVVDILDLAFTLTITLSDYFEVTHHWLAVDDIVCKIFHGFRSWLGDLSAYGLLGITLDRYFAFVVTRFKRVTCTCNNARLICGAGSFIAIFINIPFTTNFHVAVGFTIKTCLESKDSFFFVTSIFTAALPCLLTLLLTAHQMVLFFCGCRQRSETASDNRANNGNNTINNPINSITTNTNSETARNSNRNNYNNSSSSTTTTNGNNDNSTESEVLERATWGALLAMALLCVLTRFPAVIMELVTAISQSTDIIFITFKEQMRTFLIVEEICIMVSCVSLTCKLYVLLLTSPIFRQCLREACRRGARSRLMRSTAIELPADRRELTLVAEGRARETNTGQVVDLYRLNQQREKNQLHKQQSASDSVASTTSADTIITDIDHNSQQQQQQQQQQQRQTVQVHSKPLQQEFLRRISENEETQEAEREDVDGQDRDVTYDVMHELKRNYNTVSDVIEKQTDTRSTPPENDQLRDSTTTNPDPAENPEVTATPHAHDLAEDPTHAPSNVK